MRRLDVELRVDIVQRLGSRRPELFRLYAHNLLDVAGMFTHQIQDLELSRLRPVPVLGNGRAVLAGRLRQAGQKRRLCQSQVLGALAEVEAGGGLSAVRGMAVIHLVEVPFKDLTIAITSFQLERDRRLL